MSLIEPTTDSTESSNTESLLPRIDGRPHDQIRPMTITTGYLMHAEGSALIEVGNTRVVCTASVEESLPPFLRNKNKGGWLTAEYGMLPRSTGSRMSRESSKGRVGGRTHEIQRLIGRSLRQVLDLKMLGERTIKIDCDVIQADGGTRTAAITGGFVATILALRHLVDQGLLTEVPAVQQLAAISVGIVNGTPILDLNYHEDSSADVDMNVVMLHDGTFIEVQGTGEEQSFSRDQMNEMLRLAEVGIAHCFEKQRDALGGNLL